MSFDFGSTNADGSSTARSVTDKDALKAAKAGADWFCGACQSGNPGNVDHCQSCGASRQDAMPAPAPKPAYSAPKKTSRRVSMGAKGLFGSIVAFFMGSCCLCSGVTTWLNRPVEVEASVQERVWVRQVFVRRLKAQKTRGWKDQLPKKARVPGKTTRQKLRPGLGTLHECKTMTCWPRPEPGQTLARVTGRLWERTARVDRMVSSTKSGWKDKLPPANGAYPVDGQGGRTGRHGTPSCHRKQRTPKKCRTRTKQVACGTERKCTVKDKGNGFAEEVCTNRTRYCSESEEVCTDAVYGQWCTWDHLNWSTGTPKRTRGELDEPHWPELRAGQRQRLVRTATYTVKVQTLAGVNKEAFVPKSAKAFLSYDVGQQIFIHDTHSATAVPPELIRKDDEGAIDCGSDIAPDTLTTRDQCHYDLWRWKEEPVKEARSSKADPPPWPKADLGDDGQSAKRAWAELNWTWERDDTPGAMKSIVSTKEAKKWPPGSTLKIEVDADARLLKHIEPPPKTHSPKDPTW